MLCITLEDGQCFQLSSGLCRHLEVEPADGRSFTVFPSLSKSVFPVKMNTSLKNYILVKELFIEIVKYM